jgi:hypothetical protein
MSTELPYIPCCNDNCLDEFKEFIGPVCYEVLNDKGFVEYSSIQAKGLACKLLELAEKYNIGASDIFSIINVILDKGIVVYCDESGTISIASVETWLKYAEMIGLTQSAAVPA